MTDRAVRPLPVAVDGAVERSGVCRAVKVLREPEAGKPHVRVCVQRRLARSVGGSPTGVRARRPVAWMVGWRETQPRKPIDTAILGMASESPGRTARERRGGPDSEKPRRPSPQPEGEGRMTRRRLAVATGHAGGVGATARCPGRAKQLEKPSSSRCESGEAREAVEPVPPGRRSKARGWRRGPEERGRRGHAAGAKGPHWSCSFETREAGMP